MAGVLWSSNIDNFSNFVLSTLHIIPSIYNPKHVHTFFAFPPHLAHCWARVCDSPLQILQSGHFLCVQNMFYVFQEVKHLGVRIWPLRTETDPITTNKVYIRPNQLSTRQYVELCEHFVGFFAICLIVRAIIWSKYTQITNKIQFNHLNTKRRPLYLKTQSVPRCKHFSSRL